MGRAAGSDAGDFEPPQWTLHAVQAAPPNDESRQLWQTVGAIAEGLGTGWTLVGGLMVQLHAFEHGGDVPRSTRDIDILADARRVPSATEEVARSLIELGFRLLPSRSLIEPEIAFVFERDGQRVDVLAPDGVKPDRLPRTTQGQRTVPIPGGTQALKRTEVVTVRLDDGTEASVRRPTLIGAILIKARAIRVHERREDQRQDIVRLLSYLDDPLAAGRSLRKSERRWLIQAARLLRIDDDDLRDLFPDERLALARVAYRLLSNPVE